MNNNKTTVVSDAMCTLQKCRKKKNDARKNIRFFGDELLPLYHRIPQRVPPVYYFWVYGWTVGRCEDSPYTELSSRENVFNDLICVV